MLTHADECRSVWRGGLVVRAAPPTEEPGRFTVCFSRAQAKFRLDCTVASKVAVERAGGNEPRRPGFEGGLWKLGQVTYPLRASAAPMVTVELTPRHRLTAMVKF